MKLIDKKQIISDFLLNVYLYSDDCDLDNWLQFLARENGDEILAEVIDKE